MERPGRADHRVKQPPIRLHVQKKTERAVNDDGQNAVDWEEIWRQRNPEVGLSRHDMSAVRTNAELAHATTHQPHPERVRKLVSEHVNQNWTRQTEESDQPEHRA